MPYSRSRSRERYRYQERYDSEYDDTYPDDRYTNRSHSRSRASARHQQLVPAYDDHYDHHDDTVTTRTVRQTETRVNEYSPSSPHSHYETRVSEYSQPGLAHRSSVRRRVMSKQEMILAAVAGAALAVGGKEVYDRKQARDEGESEIDRSIISSAALAAGGALAAYGGAEFINSRKKRASWEYDEYDDEYSRRGNSTFLRNAIGVTTMGAAVRKLMGGGDKHHEGSQYSHGSRYAPTGREPSRVQNAAMASLLAGATEAFRVAGKPGQWNGEKTRRIVTAALGAGAVDAVHDPHKDRGKSGLVKSVVAGLIGNRVINGSRKGLYEDVDGTSRTRSRSRGRGRSSSRVRTRSRSSSVSHRSSSRSRKSTGLAALATAGLGALGAKKMRDRSRSRSQSRSRASNYYDYDDSDRMTSTSKKSRSTSVVSSGRRALSKLGLLPAADRDHDDDWNTTTRRTTTREEYDYEVSDDDRRDRKREKYYY